MNRRVLTLIIGILFLLLSVCIPEVYTSNKGWNKFNGMEALVAHAAAIDLSWANGTTGGKLGFYRWFKIVEVKFRPGRQCRFGPYVCELPSFKLRAKFYTFFAIPVEVVEVEC
jgi:hypothetical protein